MRRAAGAFGRLVRYTFQDTYHGTHQKKKFTVLTPHYSAHAIQSVYFHFTG